MSRHIARYWESLALNAEVDGEAWRQANWEWFGLFWLCLRKEGSE